MTDTTRFLPLASAPEPEGVTRRSALQGLAASLGLVAIGPDGTETTHPLAAHIVQRRPAASAKVEAEAPRFLDAHQLATLTVVADLIVPGAVASGSPAYIDRVLAVESPAVRRPFVSALASLDAAAQEQQRTTFRALTSAQQVALLESQPRVLAALKSWIAGAHYSSEFGMKELGFTGTMFHATFHACTHPDGHA